jgi:hypothetical protein
MKEKLIKDTVSTIGSIYLRIEKITSREMTFFIHVQKVFSPGLKITTVTKWRTRPLVLVCNTNVKLGLNLPFSPGCNGEARTNKRVKN